MNSGQPDAPQIPLILAVDDEPVVLRMITLALKTDGFRVGTALNGAAALEKIATMTPDLVLLDSVLPDIPGTEVLRAIRERTKIPVVMLTARASERDRIEAFELGADEFVAKPFSPQDLSATIRFLLTPREGSVQGRPVIRAGDIEIDVMRESVTRHGEAVALTPSEWRLLRELARAPGAPRLYQELLSSVWGPAYRDDLDYLRVWIRRLQNKLGDDGTRPAIITSYLGVGYALNSNGEPAVRT